MLFWSTPDSPFSPPLPATLDRGISHDPPRFTRRHPAEWMRNIGKYNLPTRFQRQPTPGWGDKSVYIGKSRSVVDSHELLLNLKESEVFLKVLVNISFHLTLPSPTQSACAVGALLRQAIPRHPPRLGDMYRQLYSKKGLLKTDTRLWRAQSI